MYRNMKEDILSVTFTLLTMVEIGLFVQVDALVEVSALVVQETPS